MGLRSFAASRSVLVVGASVLIFVLLIYAGVIENDATWTYDEGSNHLRPLALLSFRLDPWLGGYELGNVILHLGSVIALLALLHRVSPGPGAMFGTMTFALHPMFAEAVAWTEGRFDLFAATFGIVAVLLHLRGDVISQIGSWIAILLALLCKESAVCVPAILIAYDLLHRNRPGRALLWHAGSGAIVFAFFAWRGFASPPSVDNVDFVAALQRYAFHLLSFLPRLVVPFRLEALQPYEPPSLLVAGLVVFAALAASVLLVTLSRRRPSSRTNTLAWGWLWFALALVPVAVGSESTSGDRFAYLPAVGIAIMGAAGLGGVLHSLRNLDVPRVVFVGIAVAIGAGWWTLARTSSNRVRDWRTKETLLIAELRTDPRNHVVGRMLGSHYLEVGRVDEACPLLRQSLSAKKHTESSYQLALCLERLGKIPEALQEARAVLVVNPLHEGARELVGRHRAATSQPPSP
jgi:hypothetical protein